MFDLGKSLEQARKRLGEALPRARRSDRGVSRLDREVLACVLDLMSGQERPRTRDLLARIDQQCRDKGLRPPSRATVYKLMTSLPGPTYRVASLPRSVQSALYNLTPESDVPARQVAFYCFNYGDLGAMSFAAGLPWRALHQALRLRGYRQRSRGLIEAVATVRGI
ncbi:MAG: hypothetical protein V2A76_12530 [Planctomycetota bacterium]